MIECVSVNGHPCDQVRIGSRRLKRGIVLVVSGEIDLATAPTVERELLRAEEAHDLVAIDLSKTSFLDSTGLHAIIAANLRLRARGAGCLSSKAHRKSAVYSSSPACAIT